MACRRCGCDRTIERVLERGPHYAAEVCAQCGLMVRWLPKALDARRRPAGHRDLVERFSRGFCELCRRTVDQLGPRNWLIAHHVVPFAQGGGSDRDNIWILCRRCHGLVEWVRAWSKADPSNPQSPIRNP